MTNDAAFYFSNLELLVKENPSTKDIPEFIITTCMRNSGTQTPLLYAMARTIICFEFSLQQSAKSEILCGGNFCCREKGLCLQGYLGGAS
ncbi:hypothetical protein CDAR_582661 [Caerostris darwini]|uniref:Uncharacterized protein n=1 Tax=Caerostris darwini TaxID=1538125 RepID=A0AAV4PNQ6_9ARAC|nr:hypothetical protein CDAR_582661 [Caerostris darwini]